MCGHWRDQRVRKWGNPENDLRMLEYGRCCLALTLAFFLEISGQDTGQTCSESYKDCMCPTQYASCTLGTLYGWHRRPGPETQVKGHGQEWKAGLGGYREDGKPLGFLAERPGELVLDHIVERKRLDDLCSSIIDGRFREQKVP